MAGYKKVKRKGVDQVSDDFSDLSLYSPATKIRRLCLDAELAPIVEEEEGGTGSPTTPDPNHERALVVFKPLLLNSPSPSPSSFSLTLHSDLFMSGIKNQLAWSKQGDSHSDCDRLIRSAEEEQEQEQGKEELALVPWVPSSYSSPPHELMTEAEEEMEMGGEASMTMMDIEEEQDTSTNSSTPPQGFHQWHHQQHCLLPHLPQNTSTPITWTR